jgi:uncharacterized protein with HEPN domain
MSPRRDEELLLDIIERADAIARIVEDTPFDAWEANDVLVSAVLCDLLVIGEAASKLSGDLTTRHRDLPWRELVDLRNVLVHVYAHVRRDIVWPAATHEVESTRHADTNQRGSEPRLPRVS